MKFTLVALLFCTPLDAAETNDNSLRFLTTTKTNSSGAATTTDVFMRNGKTNLVQRSRSKQGMVQIRIQQLYQDGRELGTIVCAPQSFSFSSEPDSPYSVNFDCLPQGGLRSVAVATKDGAIVEAFTCTNGVLVPLAAVKLREANELGVEVKNLLSPNTKPSEFSDKLERRRAE